MLLIGYNNFDTGQWDGFGCRWRAISSCGRSLIEHSGFQSPVACIQILFEAPPREDALPYEERQGRDIIFNIMPGNRQGSPSYGREDEGRARSTPPRESEDSFIDDVTYAIERCLRQSTSRTPAHHLGNAAVVAVQSDGTNVIAVHDEFEAADDGSAEIGPPCIFKNWPKDVEWITADNVGQVGDLEQEVNETWTTAESHD